MGVEKPSGFAPGTYRGVGMGKYGPIEVEVDVGRGSLEAVRVISHREDEHRAWTALRYLPLKMVEAQRAAVDVVSGATFTSRGLIEAVERALAAAGGSADCLRAPGRGGAVPQAMSPGAYTASAQGKWAPGTVDGARFGAAAEPALVKVQVTVDESRIKDVRLLECTDNDHFVQPVIERVLPSIVEQQSVLVDAVTGATCTSAAVLKATAVCLEEAGADMRGFVSTRPRSAAEEFVSCDVCVVGGGHAGTMAALVALEAGADVLILEKAGRVGGRGFCPSGVSAAGAAVEREAGILLTADDLCRQLYEQTGGRANNLLMRAIAEDSGPMVDWLAAHGIPATPPRPDARDDEAFMCDLGRGQEKFRRLYDDFIVPLGGRIMTETRATGLHVEDGAVTGVEAVRQDGTRVRVSCGAVVVATGGFGGNPAMLRRLCHSSNFYDRGITTQCSGEGILMCERVGAQLGPEIMPHMQEYLANPVCNFTDNPIKYITYGGFLTVNQEGKRFMNECLNVEDAMGSGCASLRVQGGAYYYLISQDQVDAIRERGVGGYFDGRLDEHLSHSVASRALVPIPNLQDSLDDAVAKGQAWRGESAEELAALVGFPDPMVFVETLARYNELCRRGEDEDFGKVAALMNEHRMPLYAVRSVIPIMGTLGGVKVNERLEALGLDDAPIPGLYVAGQEGSGFYTYPYYSTRCITTTYAYCSGRLAGRNAAACARGKRPSA